MTKEEQLEYLISEYMNNKYRTVTFCDEFSRIFFREDWKNNITKEKLNLFEQLAIQCERYTPFEEDLKVSQYYVDDRFIRNEVTKVYNKMKL